jgi:hypothetical protein
MRSMYQRKVGDRFLPEFPVSLFTSRDLLLTSNNASYVLLSVFGLFRKPDYVKMGFKMLQYVFTSDKSQSVPLKYLS